jgi:hypothetical protein
MPMYGPTIEGHASHQQFSTTRCRNRAATRGYRKRHQRDPHERPGEYASPGKSEAHRGTGLKNGRYRDRLTGQPAMVGD